MMFLAFLLACVLPASLSFRFTSGLSSLSSLHMSASRGYHLTKSPLKNKGHSFPHKERHEQGLRGLFPAGPPLSLDLKVEIAMEQLRTKTTAIDKYIFLHTIQDADETLFYSILMKHTTETMPIVYTPTVGEACQKWSNIYRHTPRGLYISSNDVGHVRSMLDNYPKEDIKVIVVTDGERILGLGDQGVNGMGIPIGKLALYTACAGIDPSHCLPVHIDVGTDNEKYLADPAYMGLRQKRIRGKEYEDLLAEFFDACQDKYGRNVLIQFEDFGNANAFTLLEKYRHKATCFNDDIQGTASVVLAGVMSSLKLTKKDKLSDHTYLFYGAGEAGVGIANLIASSIAKELHVTEEEARKRIWLFDSKGVISSARTDKLVHHKQIYAHDLPKGSNGASTLLDAVNLLKPTALVGVSAQGQAFTEDVCKAMASFSEAPLILALSNPTSKAECTAEQAYTWTDGRCVFFSGSPFAPVTLKDGKTVVPGQGNNAYIFPGIGLGALAAGAVSLTDNDFTVAASTLASLVTEEQLAKGCAYPPISAIRDCSLHIAAAVASAIVKDNRGSSEATKLTDAELKQKCESLMYHPKY